MSTTAPAAPSAAGVRADDSVEELRARTRAFAEEWLIPYEELAEANHGKVPDEAPEREALQAHVASCRECAELARRAGVLQRLLATAPQPAGSEAFVEAVRRWPETGLPPSPAGRIITTARNRAVDRHRRESSRDARQADLGQRLLLG